jgi:hypothetical protein
MQSACAVLYYHQWLVWLHHIFQHYLTNGTIFGEKLLDIIKCVLWFSLQFLTETFLSVRRLHGDTIINVNMSSCTVPIILVRLKNKKIEISRQTFEKYPKIKFLENTSSGSRVVPCVRTDRHDEAKTLFAILRTRLKTSKWTEHLMVMMMMMIIIIISFLYLCFII